MREKKIPRVFVLKSGLRILIKILQMPFSDDSEFQKVCQKSAAEGSVVAFVTNMRYDLSKSGHFVRNAVYMSIAI